MTGIHRALAVVILAPPSPSSSSSSAAPTTALKDVLAPGMVELAQD
ncbi:MAG TPA: hypothetical protein VI029_06910 [Mycobacterium sp.]